MREKKAAARGWISGKVSWYDASSGKGSIISDDGIWYRIHEYSQIQTKKNKPLKEGMRVELELARDSIRPIVKTVRQGNEISESGDKLQNQLKLWEEAK